MALAIYRKYRPAAFQDLLGQELTVRILKEAAKQNKFSHAYLFAGPRGTGKTTTARLIAKTANCSTRQEDPKFGNLGEPCNKCQACKEIDAGRSLDVIEIDAASNRGIDEIRDLKENVRVAPTSLRYKVFIIDEAHQLTKDAFNALLKTLEEPPGHVIMILATTEAEKVPATISSRAQQFYFKRVPFNQIARKLLMITGEEKIKISSDALELIAAASEGSFRDAESLLDQLITFGCAQIELGDVEKMIGKVGFDRVAEITSYFLKNDMGGAIKMIEAVNEEGHNLVQLTHDLIQYLRRVAVLKWNPEMKELFGREFMKEHLETIVSHSPLFGEKHLRLLKALLTAYSQMRYSQFPLIPLEIAIIESLKPENHD